MHLFYLANRAANISACCATVCVCASVSFHIIFLSSGLVLAMSHFRVNYRNVSVLAGRAKFRYTVLLYRKHWTGLLNPADLWGAESLMFWLNNQY